MAEVAREEEAAVRSGFASRLRATRSSLGYTQEQMAYALGIQPARYSKYEIGRSEAPYGILLRIARLADVELDYLIGGELALRGRPPEPSAERLRELLDMLPTPAMVLDDHNRLLTHNYRYRDLHPDRPALLRRGTPQEVLARAWAYAQGCNEMEVEAFVRARLNPDLYRGSPVALRTGSKRLQFTEAITGRQRLVIITDLTELKPRA